MNDVRHLILSYLDAGSGSMIAIWLAAVPALFIVVALQIGRQHDVAIDVEADGSPDEWTRRLSADLSAIDRAVVEMPAAEVVSFRRTRRPVWTIVVAIMLFPVGLLALLVKVTDFATVSVKATGSGSSISVRGALPTAVERQLTNQLQASSVAAAGTGSGLPDDHL